MGRQATLSILGLYNYDNTLFNKMVFPVGFSPEQKETVIGNILCECAELESLFPDWNVLNNMIGLWSKLEMPVWERIYNASLKEYNPIENYNRTELETIKNDKSETHSGTDFSQASGTDQILNTDNRTVTHSGTDSDQTSVTSYDANTLYVHDKSELTHGETITNGGTSGTDYTYGKKDGFTHGEKIKNDDTITRNNHTSGNIGVTTSQQMLEQEINIAPMLNVMMIIVNSFKERFCVLVY